MTEMDKSWIDKDRRSAEYISEIEKFLDFAFTNAEGSNMIVCPCNRWKLGRKCWFTRDVLTHHFMFNGFLPSYKEWVHHGESIFMSSGSELCSGSHSNTNAEPNLLGHINTIGMLNDIFGVHKQEGILNDIGDPMIGEYVEFDDEPEPNGILNEEEHLEDAGYRRLVDQAEQELFSGSKFSKLSFL